jgi:hypothetical protein
MLFLSKKNDHKRVHEVILPDARLKGNDKYDDETTPVEHTSGLLVDDGISLCYRDLAGVEKVVIKAHNEMGAPTKGSMFDEKVDLKWMVHPQGTPGNKKLKLNKPKNATTVELVGGQLAASNRTEMLMVIPQHKTGATETRKITTLTTWTPNSATHGTYKIGNDPEKEFAGDVTLYIYNWEDPQPKPDDLKELVTTSNMDPEFADLDAKWIYKLFAAPNNDWPAWLDGELLPVPHTEGYPLEIAAPMTIKEKFLEPPTGTCDNFYFNEE